MFFSISMYQLYEQLQLYVRKVVNRLDRAIHALTLKIYFKITTHFKNKSFFKTCMKPISQNFLMECFYKW